ncbi:MAG: ABC transporter permease [Bacteroidota bacterium]
MWKNYIVVTLRNLARNRSFNLINISGLALGLASAILIMLFIFNELRYDRFNTNAKQIYRLYVDGKMANEEFKGAWNAPVFGPTFYEEIPEVVNFCRFDFWNNQLMWSNPEKKFLENHVQFADSTFFQVFSIKLLQGDPNTALKAPNSILLSESKASIYFPGENPLGKAVYMNNDSSVYMVTGVVEDAPESSHFYYDFIISYCTLEASRSTFWLNNFMYTYLLVDEHATKEGLEASINAVMAEHVRPLLEQFLGITLEQFTEKGNKYGIYSQRLLDIHLDTSIQLPNDAGFRPIRSRQSLVIFGLIAILILVIASINFMNLSTARSLSRSKEVSLRKVLGSGKGLLIRQFLTESTFLTMISLILAIGLVILILPAFNSLLGLSLHAHDMLKWFMIPALILLALLVGLLSGSYPAMVLASFKPVEALKGNRSGNNGSGLLRNILVVIQFSISIIIVVGTLVIFWQFRYMTNMDLGFEKDNIIVVERLDPLGRRIQTFKKELLQNPLILAASNASTYEGNPNSNSTYMIKGRDRSEGYMHATFYTDQDFMDTYNLQIADGQGRFFSRDFRTDTAACLVNETAVKKYGIEDPLNTIILQPEGDGRYTETRIIGVVKDHHFSSVKGEIEAQIFLPKREEWDWPGVLSIRVAPGEKEAALAYIKKTWEEFTADQPLQYFYLDDALKGFYDYEKRIGTLSMIFSILAIFIASLGLFGLTLYNTQKRTKEIGIRKAMGASEQSILALVSRTAMISVGLAILIAWPVAYYTMRDWLNNFPYNVGFQPLLFLGAAMLAVLIAMMTVTFSTLRSARINPGEALRYE